MIKQEKEKKVCPIFSTNSELYDHYCIEDKCAWWMGFKSKSGEVWDQYCAIEAIGYALDIWRQGNE